MGKKKTAASKLVARLKLHHLSPWKNTLPHTCNVKLCSIIFKEEKYPLGGPYK